ncbi:MAG: SDR family NAD(P)-dependent oxidoreductase, partial [Bacteroidota bacterium]
ILITGSTDGIGKLAAIKLANDEHEILLHGRNATKLEKVIAEVKAMTNNENIKGFVADFSDLAAVKKMAEEVKSTVSQIDVFVNNAGVFKSTNTHNKAGLELRFVVNYFAPYILTHELLALVQKSDAPRIINLSSAAQAPVSSEALKGNKTLPLRDAYAQSKLALTMWSFYLAQQYSDISIIALNPGSLLNTNMVREAYGRHWSSADKGANIIYDLAVSEKYEGVTNKYFDNDSGRFGSAHADAYDTEMIEKLVRETKTIISNL